MVSKEGTMGMKAHVVSQGLKKSAGKAGGKPRATMQIQTLMTEGGEIEVVGVGRVREVKGGKVVFEQKKLSRTGAARMKKGMSKMSAGA